jgi:hypothetical protein
MPATPTAINRRPWFCLQVNEGRGLYPIRNLEVARTPPGQVPHVAALKSMLLYNECANSCCSMLTGQFNIVSKSS